MLVAINCDWGGYDIPNHLVKKIGANGTWDSRMEVRTHPELVCWVLKHPGYTSLDIVEVPDGATDILICDYDGIETLYYVLNGKIHRAEPVCDYIERGVVDENN